MSPGRWRPPSAGKFAPNELKKLMKDVYSSFRDRHPSEDPETKALGARIAWGAAKKAGWKKMKSGWRKVS